MLFDIDSFREIGQTLSRNRSRTLLTGFGIFWGIFMLLTMLGAGDGLKRMLSSLFDGFATNTVICGPAQTQEPYGGFQKGRTWTLNTADLGILRSRVPGIDVLTPILSGFSATPEHKERSFSGGRLSGVYPDYSKISTPRMKFGRYINSTDVEQKRKVCVIGRRVYEKLFPGGEDPTGQFIRLKETGNMFMIVGVNSRKSAISIGGTDDSMITVPFSVLNQMYSRGDRIDLFCMTVKKGWTSDEIQEQVRSVLFHIHGISPTDKEALMAIDTAKIFSIVDSLFSGLDILILLVGLGTLLAGAIGVSNIMMVTVKERTVEIGIRRAIGATPRMVVGQIMSESIALTLVAGAIGILAAGGLLALGTMIVQTQPDFETTSFQIGFWTGIGALFLIVALGVLAGLAPASRAMNIKPVEAIADE